MNITNEHPVYIIELEQPWENWCGTLRSYYPTSNFCEVEDNKGEIHKVRCNEVLDFSTMENIKNVLI